MRLLALQRRNKKAALIEGGFPCFAVYLGRLGADCGQITRMGTVWIVRREYTWAGPSLRVFFPPRAPRLRVHCCVSGYMTLVIGTLTG